MFQLQHAAVQRRQKRRQFRNFHADENALTVKTVPVHDQYRPVRGNRFRRKRGNAGQRDHDVVIAGNLQYASTRRGDCQQNLRKFAIAWRLDNSEMLTTLDNRNIGDG